MTISEQIIQEPIKEVKHEPTKMTEAELEGYRLMVEQRALELENQVKKQLNDIDNSQFSTT